MKKRIIALVAIVIAGSLGGGYAALRARSGHKAAKASSKQTQYVKLSYPGPTGKAAPDITTVYDDASGRTRMTIALRNLTIVSSGAYKAGGAELLLTSSFKGRTRKASKAEASVDGAMSVRANAPGLLAASKPPGVFTIDGRHVNAHRLDKSDPGYTSTNLDGGAKETLAFKLDTTDLLALGGASSATGRFGALEFSLTPAQLAELREFAARMNPDPTQH